MRAVLAMIGAGGKLGLMEQALPPGFCFTFQVQLPADSRHAAVCFPSEDILCHSSRAHCGRLFRKLSPAEVIWGGGV